MNLLYRSLEDESLEQVYKKMCEMSHQDFRGNEDKLTRHYDHEESVDGTIQEILNNIYNTNLPNDNKYIINYDSDVTHSCHFNNDKITITINQAEELHSCLWDQIEYQLITIL